MAFKSESKRPGEFIASTSDPHTPSFENGVLAEGENLHDGDLVRRDGAVLRAWTGDGEVAGILLEPGRDEISSGRRRVVFLARNADFVRARVNIPEGHEETALAQLALLDLLPFYARFGGLPENLVAPSA